MPGFDAPLLIISYTFWDKLPELLEAWFPYM